MRRTDLRTALQLAAVILAIAFAATAVLYGDAIGNWAADTFFSETQSQIEQILE